MASQSLINEINHITSEAPFGPEFIVIKMCVTSKNWKEGVSQSSSGSIKWITIAMLLLLKPDINVDASGSEKNGR